MPSNWRHQLHGHTVQQVPGGHTMPLITTQVSRNLANDRLLRASLNQVRLYALGNTTYYDAMAIKYQLVNFAALVHKGMHPQKKTSITGSRLQTQRHHSVIYPCVDNISHSPQNVGKPHGRHTMYAGGEHRVEKLGKCLQCPSHAAIPS